VAVATQLVVIFRDRAKVKLSEHDAREASLIVPVDSAG
jgi:hypothetical protein